MFQIKNKLENTSYKYPFNVVFFSQHDTICDEKCSHLQKLQDAFMTKASLKSFTYDTDMFSSHRNNVKPSDCVKKGL